ncbi:MAG: hypothetical protein WAU63_10025, partial [Methylovirgula sp.]
MNLTVNWQSPLQLTHNGRIIVDETSLPQEIKGKAGVYFFSRRFGKAYIPFYIGETNDIRLR